MDALAKKGISAVSFREPSDSRWGKEIKKKAVCAGSLKPEEELNLFQRDRRENVEKNLLPSLSEKMVVILDRYYYSTMAYQGAKGISIEDIRRTNEIFAPSADLVFILDVDEKLGMKRISDRKVKDTHFEDEKYLSLVRENFLSLRGENIFRIDGAQSAAVIHKKIKTMVMEYLETQNAKLKAQSSKLKTLISKEKKL